MRVLGIDPGYDRLGVSIIEHSNSNDSLLYSDCILTNKHTELSDRLLVAGTAIANLIETHQPTIVAIETLFFNKNQKTAIGVAQIRGICIYLAKQAGCTVVEYGPQEIKIAVTGYGKSDKPAVIAMVCRLISNPPANALDDEYDAIAVALTAAAHHRTAPTTA